MNQGQSMNRGQITGIILLAGAAIQLLLFFIGVVRRSYLALALPVTAAMLAMTALTAWVGWTMLTLEEEADEAPVKPIPPSAE